MTNEEFLKAIFGDKYLLAHVTSFHDDPSNIPEDRRGICWAGGYYKDTKLSPGSNQFYTISTFNEVNGRSYRRKKCFSQCHVIGLDDVKEKLPLHQVQRLPKPTIVVQTSMYSEQWLYVLATPSTDQHKIDNLLDGLVACGLAPDGRDPGMKGITRYLRLPEGCNTKAKRIVENDGKPFQCAVLEYNPFHRYSLEQIAKPFNVDLDAPRRSLRIDGAADIPDHPLLQIPDLIFVKEERSNGRFDITCPWVHEHTDMDDSGSAVFTNADGTMGFKCHHGGCQNRTGADLLNYVEGESPGFKNKYRMWQLVRELNAPPKEVLFLGSEPVIEAPNALDGLERVAAAKMKELKAINPATPAARNLSTDILKAVDQFPTIELIAWHDKICDTMGWSKITFKAILKDLRAQWYLKKMSNPDFFNNVLWVRGLNQFYDFKCQQFFTADAFQNSFSSEEAEARKMALQDGRVKKVDRLDYAPGEELIFVEKGITYGNTWVEEHINGREGAVDMWLDHFSVVGWEEHRLHVLQWMAHTILHPEVKINHMLLLGSGEGAGKDYLLYPLLAAMGRNGMVISGEELMDGFNDYLLTTKYLHFNEVDLGDCRMSRTVGNRLKPIAAAPPLTLRVNQKGVKRIEVRNIVNGTMSTNGRVPLEIIGVSRRYYAMWTDFTTRDEEGEVSNAWNAYWDTRWKWMEGGGVDACIWYLRNRVDISSFNPGAPPPMTDYLRDIAYAAQTPGVQSIMAFISAKIGAFKSDLVTAHEVSATMQAGDILYAEGMYADRKVFTPVTVGRMLGEMHGMIQLRGKGRGEQLRLWAVRNTGRYISMTPSQIYEHYYMHKAPTVQHQLRVVK